MEKSKSRVEVEQWSPFGDGFARPRRQRAPLTSPEQDLRLKPALQAKPKYDIISIVHKKDQQLLVTQQVLHWLIVVGRVNPWLKKYGTVENNKDDISRNATVVDGVAEARAKR